MIKYFKLFLKENKNQTDERIGKILHIIDVANKTLKKMPVGYDDFYLFDDTNHFSSYKSLFFKKIGKYAAYNEKQITQIKYCLDLLSNFYTELRIDSNKSCFKNRIISIKASGEFDIIG